MISVIVPIYNVEAYLPKCLDSLAAQTFPDAEFILIDDGSTDRSAEIASAYVGADPRFFVYHTTNHGLSAARNLGIEKARGDWLMFVDPDDYVTPDFCETPYRDALREEADLVIFGYSMQQAVIRITLTDPGCLLSAGSLIRRRQCIMVVLLLGTSSTGGSCSISSAIRREGSTRISQRPISLFLRQNVF